MTTTSTTRTTRTTTSIDRRGAANIHRRGAAARHARSSPLNRDVSARRTLLDPLEPPVAIGRLPLLNGEQLPA